ncbi:MAG: hypothetical protein ACI3ZY_08600 [Parabacteroides sp.]
MNEQSSVAQRLAALPEEKKALFKPLFGSVERFYTVVYLVARNEHLTDIDKPNRYQDRLQVIRQVKGKIERLVDVFGLPGEEIVADITSDYLEDFVAYRERSFNITNDAFLSILRKIAY